MGLEITVSVREREQGRFKGGNEGSNEGAMGSTKGAGGSRREQGGVKRSVIRWYRGAAGGSLNWLSSIRLLTAYIIDSNIPQYCLLTHSASCFAFKTFKAPKITSFAIKFNNGRLLGGPERKLTAKEMEKAHSKRSLRFSFSDNTHA